MLQVLEECEHVSTDFGPIRFMICVSRCAVAVPGDGLMALDPDPTGRR